MNHSKIIIFHLFVLAALTFVAFTDNAEEGVSQRPASASLNEADSRLLSL